MIRTRWKYCVVMFLVFLAAVTAQASNTKLMVWFGEGHQFNPAFETLVAEFEKRNPDITVEVRYLGTSNYLDRLVTATLGGSPPDVVYLDHRNTHELRARKLLTPLNSIFEGEEARLLDARLWMPNAPLEVSHQGIWYGLPFRTDIRGIFVNIDLLEQGGVDPYTPMAALSDLNVLARKLTRWNEAGEVDVLGFSPVGNNINELYWMLAFGGQVFDWDIYRLTLADFPENRAALDWMIEYAETYGARNTGTVQRFREGKLAVHVNSTSQLEGLPLTAPEVRWWTHPMVYEPGGVNPTHSSVIGTAIPTGAANLDAAKRFMLYLASKDAQVLWYRLTRMPPMSLEALLEVFAEMSDPREINLIEQWPETNARLPLFERVQKDPDYGYKTLLNRVLRKEATPAEFFENVSKLNEVFASVFGE